MLTAHDISIMENTVRGIICMWDTTVTVLKPLPIDEQPNWNEHLHEYSGEIAYNQYDNIMMERKDQVSTHMYDEDIKDGAGDMNDGRLVFNTSDKNSFIDKTCRLLYDGHQWKIDTIKHRIGEILIIVSKIVGSNENWAKSPSNVGDANV